MSCGAVTNAENIPHDPVHRRLVKYNDDRQRPGFADDRRATCDHRIDNQPRLRRIHQTCFAETKFGGPPRTEITTR
jgi:hypothetical protein